MFAQRPVAYLCWRPGVRPVVRRETRCPSRRSLRRSSRSARRPGARRAAAGPPSPCCSPRRRLCPPPARRGPGPSPAPEVRPWPAWPGTAAHRPRRASPRPTRRPTRTSSTSPPAYAPPPARGGGGRRRAGAEGRAGAARGGGGRRPATGGGGPAAGGGGRPPPAGAAPPPPSTATVVRTDLATTVLTEGTLGYAPALPIVNQIAGTYTWLPAVGRRIRAGRALYRVDNLPIVLMRGGTPAWRPFVLGMTDGPDVRELQANLIALQYATGLFSAPTAPFDWPTPDPVKRWPLPNGSPMTGQITLGQVVFLPSAVL